MVRRNHSGFSLVELLIVVGITSFLFSVLFVMLNNAQGNFFVADTSIDVRNNLRIASERIVMELRNTGYKGGVAQFAILDAAGPNNSDIIRFSIPIICTTNGNLLDANGNPAYWGAPLTWGCDSSSCMDANNDCAVEEYKYVQYGLNNSNQLERKVLDDGLTVINGSTKIEAQNISDFQVSLAGNEITVNITGLKKTVLNRTITMTLSNKVLINNQGG